VGPVCRGDGDVAGERVSLWRQSTTVTRMPGRRMSVQSPPVQAVRTPPMERSSTAVRRFTPLLLALVLAHPVLPRNRLGRWGAGSALGGGHGLHRPDGMGTGAGQAARQRSRFRILPREAGRFTGPGPAAGRDAAGAARDSIAVCLAASTSRSRRPISLQPRPPTATGSPGPVAQSSGSDNSDPGRSHGPGAGPPRLPTGGWILPSQPTRAWRGSGPRS
jgi:hypothetical protein